ncbi:MAG: hypothetical protein WDM92_11535 [Caulobacteraceae bacterium]
MPRSPKPAGVSDVSAKFVYDTTGADLTAWAPHRPVRAGEVGGRAAVQAGVGLRARRRPARGHRRADRPGERRERDQVLLGVTGSGKTFTMAKVIEATQRPA